MADFEGNYPQNPWSVIDRNQRQWYFPNLYREYARRAIFNNYVTVKFNTVPGATEMYLDTLIRPEANWDTLGLSDIWGNASHTDSLRRKIVYSRYGGKMSLNKYQD